MRVAAIAVLALGLLAPALPAAAPARRPATAPVVAAPNYAMMVTRAPNGAYVLGNPRAKVRVVEYASLTCSHCAAFAGDGLPALRDTYIRRGQVSLELRHAVRDRADMAASLLARCAGPRGYFATLGRLFAAQGEWLPKAAATPEPAATPGSDGEGPAAMGAMLVATANGAGLPAIAHVTPAAAAACLRDPAGQAALGAMADEAWGTRRIPGTPAFLINDVAATGTGWAALEPQIAAALR